MKRRCSGECLSIVCTSRPSDDSGCSSTWLPQTFVIALSEHTFRNSVRERIARAKIEEAAGRPWRAKEMLGGCIGNLRYGLDHELLAAYGALLDRLGDRYEAGKYLFLSGSNDPDHQDAVQLYLHRNRNTAVNDLVAQFPGVIRHQGLGNLPEAVRSELENRGIARSELQRTEPQDELARPVPLKGSVLIFLLFVFFVLSLLFWGIGLLTCIFWVVSLID